MMWPSNLIASCRFSAVDVLPDGEPTLEACYVCTRRGADWVDRQICGLHGDEFCKHYRPWQGPEAILNARSKEKH